MSPSIAINNFLVDKVAKVRASTDSMPTPAFTHAPDGSSPSEFCLLNVDDISRSVRQLPDKSLAADPIPTFVLKQIIDLIVPFVTELFDRSLATGCFPSPFKDAFITPIVKKVGLESSHLTQLMSVHIGRFPTFPYCRSCWSGLSPTN